MADKGERIGLSTGEQRRKPQGKEEEVREIWCWMVAFFCGGQAAVLSRIIYSVVGLAGLWCVSLLFRERAPEQAAA